MAAHALTIINQELARPPSVICKNVIELCCYAPGFDLGSLEVDDWTMLNDAATNGDVQTLIDILQSVRLRVAYQMHYASLEHIRSAQMRFHQITDAALSTSFSQLSCDRHALLAIETRR